MIFFGSLDDFSNKEVDIKDRIRAEYCGFEDNTVNFVFPEQSVDYMSAKGFAILDSLNNQVWFSSANITGDTYSLKLDGFDYLALNTIPVRYKMYLVFEEEDKFIFSRLYSKTTKEEYLETGNKALLYNREVGEAVYDGVIVHLIPNCTTSGYLGFILIKKSSRLNYLITNYVESFDVIRDKFIFNVKMDKVSGCNDFGVTLKSKVNPENFYDIKPVQTEDMGEYYVLHYSLPRHFLDLDHPDVLHMCSYYVLNDYRYVVAVRTVDDELSYNIRQLSIKDNDRKNNDIMEFSFRSPKNLLQFPTILPHSGFEITTENTPQRILFSPEFVAKRVAFGHQSIDEKGRYVISMNMDISQVNDLCVFVHNSKTKSKIILDIVSCDPNKGDIVVDFSAMRGNVEDFTSRSYAVCVGFSYNGFMYCVKLKSPEYTTEVFEENTEEDITERYFDAVTQFVIKDTIVTISPFYSKNGYFYIKVRDRLLEKLDHVMVQLENSSIHKNILQISADITDSDKVFTGFALSYVYRKSEDKRVYFIKGDLVAKGNRTLLKAKIDLSKYELHRTRWNLFAVFMEDDIPYFAKIMVSDDEIESMKFPWRNLFKDNCYRIKTEQGTDVFFPYYAINKTQAYTMREESEYDSKRFRFKELFCLGVYKIFKKHYHRKKIVIIYEKFGSSAQDNGFQFFRHCMEHKVEKRLGAHIYYVIDKKSPDYQRVKKYDDRVLDFLSIKHIVYMIASRLLVSSDSRPHSYAWKANNSLVLKIIRNKKLFFLQHGVLALKRVDNLMGKTRSEPFNMFVTSSEQEKKIVQRYFKYDEDEICVTGLARWDVLEDKSKDYNEILLMPTWRNWLDEAEDSVFLESDYYKGYTELLSSERLQQILEKYNLKMNFYMHPKFKDFVDKFDSFGRIHIVQGEEPLNELLMRCKLLITDYSSVSWDIFYMGKPVLFYQFDYEMYNKIHSSYIDMTTELFGDRSITLDGLCDDLERAIKMDFRLPYKYELMREGSFAYIDDNNCSRIVQEIRKMKW
jgi:CDP-glycerol glycerophosphotransferase (TagB/SpsB family)